MARDYKTIRFLLTTVLTVLIGLLVLQAIGYGAGFVLDPENGVREFGTEALAVADDTTLTLVAMVGAGMLGSAALLILSAILVWRSNPAGTYIAVVMGGIYLFAGVCAFRADWWWDARFYSITGASLIILSAAVRTLQFNKNGKNPKE